MCTFVAEYKTINNYHHANQTNVISDDEYGAEYGSLLSSPCTSADSGIADGEAGPWPGGFACPGQGNLPQLAIAGYGQQERMLRHRKRWKDQNNIDFSISFCCILRKNYQKAGNGQE